MAITDNGTSITVNAGISGCDICACSGNQGSSYYLAVSNVSNYTFSTSVRPLYITITKSNYIPYTAVTGGTFTSDEDWFGQIRVLGNVNLSSDHTLKIHKGAIVEFSTNRILNINGHLIAEGTSENMISFTSSSSWAGIYFGSGSSGILDYCLVEKVQGLWFSCNFHL